MPTWTTTKINSSLNYEHRQDSNKKKLECTSVIMMPLRLAGVPDSYTAQAEEAQRGFQSRVQHLLAQRKMPLTGWAERDVERLLLMLADMDSNNFDQNCGAGEREGRVYSGLVYRRWYGLAHGIGRSGDLREPQPKATGSSILNQLTNQLTLDFLRQNGLRRCEDCFVAPLATGMAITLCLLTIRTLRPEAKYVIWSRVDQKSCLKAILTAGYVPVVLELVRFGDELRTDKHALETVILTHGGPTKIAAVITCTSCFAPRVSDDVPAVAQVCARLDIPHLVNNAYGLQSSKCISILEESGRADKGRRVDAFIQSTDKNLMVPVGGSIIAGFDEKFIKAVSATYPGRASSGAVMDVFITLLQMGMYGYKELMKQRKENFALLKDEMTRIAETYGERVLETKNNPISIAMTLSTVTFDQDSKSISEIGSMLFKRGVSGARVVTGHDTKVLGCVQLKGWGAHSAAMQTPYLTVAASIGMTKSDISVLAKRLDKVLAMKFKQRKLAAAQDKGGAAEEPVVDRQTPVLSCSSPQMSLFKNGAIPAVSPASRSATTDV